MNIGLKKKNPKFNSTIAAPLLKFAEKANWLEKTEINNFKSVQTQGLWAPNIKELILFSVIREFIEPTQHSAFASPPPPKKKRKRKADSLKSRR